MTSDELIAAIVRDAALPSGRGQFTDTNLLALLNEAMVGPLYALAMSVREDYFLTYADAIVAPGVVRYALPPRAGVGKVMSIHFVGSDDREREQLQRVNSHDAWRWSTDASGEPRVFWFQGDEVHVAPKPRNPGYLRMRYFRAPSTLVPLANAARISAYDDLTGTLTTAAPLPASLLAAEYLDIVRGRPGWGPLATDILVNTAAGSTIVVSAGLPAPLPMVVGDGGGHPIPTGLTVGDYVCVAGESPFPWLPTELHQLLAQAVVVEVARIQSDTEAYGLASRDYERMEAQVRKLMAAGGGRAEASPKRAAPRSW